MRYNRSDLGNTMEVAIKSSKKNNNTLFVFATAYGFTICKEFAMIKFQNGYKVENGNVSRVGIWAK